MSTALDDWKARLATLSGRERAELAYFLLDSLEPETAGAGAAWDEEASRRVREIQAGTAPGREADAFLAELRERRP